MTAPTTIGRGLDCHHVESHGVVLVLGMHLQPQLRRTHDAMLFVAMDARRSPSKMAIAAQAYFDDQDDPVMQGDQIQFATTPAKVALQDLGAMSA